MFEDFLDETACCYVEGCDELPYIYWRSCDAETQTCYEHTQIVDDWFDQDDLSVSCCWYPFGQYPRPETKKKKRAQ